MKLSTKIDNLIAKLIAYMVLIDLCVILWWFLKHWRQ